ncbi:MAG: hypothetical protein KU37_10135 [Sulfuricurvum sp. PC08-66]|nr:MAG: hypothetical protein KU37_10135 [Sulfuricurvum sp. PC08-66]
MKKALVLLNMGGPNSLDEVSLFLKNMFSDKHILPIPNRLVRSLVAWIITKRRTPIAQENYRQLGGKSPLVSHSNHLRDALQERLGDEWIVTLAMRYTPPFAHEAIEELQTATISHLYLLPMYPHHSTTTTDSSVEDFLMYMSMAHWDVTTTIMGHYYAFQSYNEAIVTSILENIEHKEIATTSLIFSAHGLPQSVIDKGDLYEKHIEAHVEILKKMLREKGVVFADVTLAYQSKVGPMKWLEPSLESALEKQKEYKKALIYPIAFTVDNSETEFELSIEYAHKAKELGYDSYRVVPALNAHPMFVDALTKMVQNA